MSTTESWRFGGVSTCLASLQVTCPAPRFQITVLQVSKNSPITKVLLFSHNVVVSFPSETAEIFGCILKQKGKKEGKKPGGGKQLEGNAWHGKALA